MVDLNHCFKKNAQIIYKELADGPVLIDPYRRTLIRLNETALEAWRMLDGERSVSGIIELLRDRFETDGASVEKDIAGFLRELIKREMIR